MKRKLPIIIISFVVFLLLVLGVIVWQKSQTKSDASPESASKKTKKVDLASQPQWVQDLQVTATKGQGSRLPNLTFVVTGIKPDTVKELNYTAYFDTSNRGTQGSQNTRGPIDLTGKTEFTHTFDLGTCSSGTCLAYQGITSIELELNFIGLNGEEFAWAKTLDVK